jgi:hypothetical protein
VAPISNDTRGSLSWASVAFVAHWPGTHMSVVYYQLFRRRMDLRPEQFNAKLEAYIPIANQLAEMLGAKVTFAREWGAAINDAIAVTRGARPPFDAVVRFRIADPAGLITRFSQPDSKQLMEEVQRVQTDFADLGDSVFGFSEVFAGE